MWWNNLQLVHGTATYILYYHVISSGNTVLQHEVTASNRKLGGAWERGYCIAAVTASNGKLGGAWERGYCIAAVTESSATNFITFWLYNKQATRKLKCLAGQNFLSCHDSSKCANISRWCKTWRDPSVSKRCNKYNQVLFIWRLPKLFTHETNVVLQSYKCCSVSV